VTNGNINTDPLFARAPNHGGDGWGDNPATADVNEAANDDYGELWLQAGSPCINAGNNSALPQDRFDLDADGDTGETIPYDLEEADRITGGIVDIGAYEYHGVATLYVDARATGANTGSNWPNAFRRLQDAIARTGNMVKPVEIRVAHGTHRPDEGVNQTPGDREASFQLVNWVTIKGGYAGTGAADPDARDVAIYETVLSGDLRDNDLMETDTRHLLEQPSRSDNSFHVLTGSGIDYTAVLEGVVVTGGNANGFGRNRKGGGGLFDEGSPTLVTCRFRFNAALTGGGLYCQESTSELSACTFGYNHAGNLGGALHMEDCDGLALKDCVMVGNSAHRDGGAVCLSNSVVVQMQCTYQENWAGDNGGGLFSDYSAPRLAHCAFRDNSAQLGAGVFSHRSESVLLGCDFRGNQAKQGAGLYSQRLSLVSLANCLFRQNTAAENGGGVFGQSSDLELKNCTLTNNIAQWQGGGAYGAYSDVRLLNCIFWSNLAPTDPELASFQSTVDLQGSYCNVRGGLPDDADAEGNLDIDPGLTPDGHLTADSPCIDAGNSDGVSGDEWLTQDFDTDLRVFDDPNVPDTGVGSEQIVDMGADEFIDRDGDSLPDWWELKYFDDPNAAEPDADSDGDGMSNRVEYEEYSSHPTAQPLYVDQANQDDPSADGTEAHPFPRIQQGLDSARDGDTVLVRAGSYQGEGNRNLDFKGKSIVLFAAQGRDRTVIDCEDAARAFDFHSGESAGSVIGGFTITRAQAAWGGAIRLEKASPQVRNCIFTANYDPEGQAGSLSARLSYPTLADCTIRDNEPNSIYLEHGGARILGTVALSSGLWRGQDLMLSGSGALHVDANSVLMLNQTRIRCDLTGSGMIKVPLASELILEKAAQVDLMGAAKGYILCDGLLHMKDAAQIHNAEILVARASFENNAVVSNSVITAEASSPYGQFFVEDTALISGNEIHADGDRYMDLDPSVFQGVIENNRIYVSISEGQGNTLGGLLELRARDLDTSPCPPERFVCQLPEVPAFDSSTWTVERLELLPGAKVNLTNRFDFGNGDLSEVMYVKDLVLGDSAVLNTGFNRLYYEHLEQAPTATIIDVPLLGFSLSNISFDSEDDFSSRVVHNNFVHVQNLQYDRIHVQRLTGQEPDPLGVMQVQNLRERDPESPRFGMVVYARAKGLFSKSSEDRILVMFEYLFETDDPGTELVVYLSDAPELQESRDPDHHVEVGRIRPPRRGRPGSVGSARFATFHTYTHRHHLNFMRGTRIELELIGPAGTRILINNWDPQVHCGTPCMDLDGTGVEDNFDLMVVLGESGKSAELGTDGTGNECVDGVLSDNGYADTQDVISTEWALDTNLGNLCPAADRKGRGLPLLDSDMVSLSSPLSGLNTEGGSGFSSPLLILGQGRWNMDASGNLGTERIYGLDGSGQYLNTYDFGGEAKSHAKLIRQRDDAVYSVNITQGILQLNDDGPSHVVLSNGQYAAMAQGDVYIGVQSDGLAATGRPVWDAVVNADSVYVVPVVVAPGPESGGIAPSPYLAAAKLSRSGGVEVIYDDPGFRDPVAPDNPHIGGLREIEVDAAGRVYVLNAHRRNLSDAVWQYSPDGHVNWRIELGDPSKPRSVSDLRLIEDSGRPVYVPNPTGLCVSDKTERVYLASGYRDEQNINQSYVYGFSMADGRLERIVTINDMQIVTDITEDPDTGTLWVVGYNLDAHALAADSYLDISESFYQARLVRIANEDVDIREVTAHAIEPSDGGKDHDLALPLSILWNGSNGTHE